MRLFLLLLTCLVLSGCIDFQDVFWDTREQQSWQDKAIEKHDYTLCLKASYPDVCLESYARETKDDRACQLIKDPKRNAACLMANTM